MLKIFCLTVPENFVAEPFILPLSLRIEIIYALKGYVRIFWRKFLSHSTENFRRGTRNPSVLCFRKFLVAKKFVDKKEGECQYFPPKKFCLTVPKHFVEERGTLLCCVSENFW